MIQKKFGVRIEIRCEPERLSYSIRDYSGGRTFTAPYETLAIDNLPTLTFANMAFFRRTLLIPLSLLILSILTTQNTPLSEGIALLCFICFAGLLSAKLRNFFSVTFTQIPMQPLPPGSDGHLIRIIQDKNHDDILANIIRHWKARMLALYGEVQPNIDPEIQAARFNWLRKHNVIDDKELRIAMSKIEALVKAGVEQPSGSIN
jgi:hypothetical protein